MMIESFVNEKLEKSVGNQCTSCSGRQNSITIACPDLCPWEAQLLAHVGGKHLRFCLHSDVSAKEGER
jgi:hypothetical protein